jgi:hypothetical protein
MVKVIDEDVEDLINECHRFVALCYFYNVKSSNQNVKENVSVMKNAILQCVEYLRNNFVKEVD